MSEIKTVSDLEKNIDDKKEEEKKDTDIPIDFKKLDYCIWITNRYYICIGDVIRIAISRSVIEGKVVDILKYGSRLAIDTGDKITFVNISRVTWITVISRGEISKDIAKGE